MTWGGQIRSHWKHEVHSSWPVASSYSRIGKLRNASGNSSRSSGYCTVKTPVVSAGVSSFLANAPAKCLITTSRPASMPWPARSLGLPRSTTYVFPRVNSTVIAHILHCRLQIIDCQANLQSTIYTHLAVDFAHY